MYHQVNRKELYVEQHKNMKIHKITFQNVYLENTNIINKIFYTKTPTPPTTKLNVPTTENTKMYLNPPLASLTYSQDILSYLALCYRTRQRREGNLISVE